MSLHIRVSCDGCSESYVSESDVGRIVGGELLLGCAQLARIEIPPSWNIVDSKRLLCGYCDAFRRKLGPVTITEATKPRKQKAKR
jgi:hypothetical protein